MLELYVKAEEEAQDDPMEGEAEESQEQPEEDLQEVPEEESKAEPEVEENLGEKEVSEEPIAADQGTVDDNTLSLAILKFTYFKSESCF